MMRRLPGGNDSMQTNQTVAPRNDGPVPAVH